MIELNAKRKSILIPSDSDKAVAQGVGLVISLALRKNILVIGFVIILSIRHMIWRGLGRHLSWKHWTFFHSHVTCPLSYKHNSEIDWKKLFISRFKIEKNWETSLKRPLDLPIIPEPSIVRFNSFALFFFGGKKLQAFQLHTGKPFKTFKSRSFLGSVLTCLEVDEQYLICGTSKGKILVWNIHSPLRTRYSHNTLMEILVDELHMEVLSCKFVGSMVAFATSKRAGVVDMKTGCVIKSWSPVNLGNILSSQLDTEMVAIAYENGLEIYDLNTKEPLFVIPLEGVKCFQLDWNMRKIVVGFQNKIKVIFI